ncbi:MAG: hypothetical protein JOY80_08485 [Candidatus Dormibacteraeota bacterium]|nr:hypothetical protein [Candidatus Dormibacteraeota bacterium]
MQWYTPLLAWWLPQRTIVYGFAAALSVLLLVYAGMSEARRSWSPFVVAGVLVGLLPIVHIQTLFALAVILFIVALRHRRREWLGLFGVAAVIAAPRLVQVALAPHGSAAAGNAYPWFEPGWLATAPNRIDLSFTGAFIATGQALRQLVSATWWGFWTVNLGIVVPLAVILLIVAVTAHVPGAVARWSRSVLRAVPAPLLELFLAASVIFALCNVVVFQSWDWDNTKLLVYWYLAIALLIGAFVTRAACHLWRSILTWVLVATMLLTGSLVMLRYGPWTPQTDQVGGPYVVADQQEQALAATVLSTTPEPAVFLTFGRPNDPLLAVGGRTGVMGYYGWLWSYGTAFGTRYTDVQLMYQGCSNTSTTCSVDQLLRRYDVSFVEIDDRASDPGAVTPTPDIAWWASQGFPIVARSQHITVYDVRSVSG